MTKTTIDIETLSRSEKIKLIERLYDSMTQNAQSQVIHTLQHNSAKAKSQSAYTVSQAANALGLSPSTVKLKFDTGQLQGYCIDGPPVARIRHDDLVKFMRQQKMSQRIPKSDRDPSTIAYTTGQVAKICQVQSRTALRWVRSGKLNGYFVAGGLERRIPHDSLVEFAKSNDITLNKAA